MNKSCVLGVVCGFLCAAFLTFAAVSHMSADTNLGTTFCTARNSQPVCTGAVAHNALVGYSFAPGSAPKDGDPLLCNVVRHNNWYFTWDNRGHGWYNDMSYTYSNCTVGREA